MTAGFELELHVPDPPDVVWARLWDLDRHTASVPLTRVAGRVGPGERFVARTSVGPLGFDDVMVVRSWEPPRRAVVDKVGRVLAGRIEVDVVPDGPGTVVRWRQEYGAPLVPDRVAALGAPLVRSGYRRSLARIVGAAT
ncbi:MULTISPECIES: SRPBCC family protein [unclassified Ornithinimicrobium]|uniref:SRPBCC family protein n=1 Tax=unclassified Ornithinimicrobium TaxID=2615080 RepID=UPI003854B25E